MARDPNAERGLAKASARAGLIGSTLALCALAAVADSIMIGGTTHKDVYVIEGNQLYYIRFPATGKVVSVRKNSIAAENVKLSRDPARRARLLQQWKAKYYEAHPDKHAPVRRKDPASGASPATPTQERDTPARVLPPVSNIPPDKKKDRPLFINREGVVTFTNRPERYRARSDYIEVRLHFDIIAVPKRYRLRTAERARQYDASTVRELVAYFADLYGVDPNLVLAVIRQESDFTVHARSRAGACGLMQLMPGTAAEMGVQDIFDPAENIAGGAQYLAKMLRLFNGDLDLALAGYNAGPGSVKKHGGVPPFRETKDYVRRVRAFYREYAAGKGAVKYVASGPALPSKAAADGEAPYVVHFKNGWTQPAEEVAESDECYFVTMGGRTTQIRKTYVESIRKPATG